MPVHRIVVVPKPLEALPPAEPIASVDPELAAIARRLEVARSEHAATLTFLRQSLAQRADVTWLDTPAVDAFDDLGATLIVTVGGDGTFLMAARHARATPMMGVNSSPATSTGHYCLAIPDTFLALLEDCLAGRRTPTPLQRIRSEIDGRALPHDALNDVLFANRTPVSSTRYAMRVGETTELQLSSGIWIATASGSTAAICSAGGEVRPMTDRRLQWRVREPQLADGLPRTLLSGFTESLEIVSRSDRNALFVDGHGEPYAVCRGARARLSRSPEPLLAFV